MKIIKILVSLLLIFVTLVVGLDYKPVYASHANDWTPDAKVPGYLDDTFTPFLVADQNKTVHAFATQWVGVGTNRKRAIVYRQWTLAGGWTRSVDILLSPTWDAQMLGVYLSPDGKFHLVFWGSGTESVKAGVYYSSAVAKDAKETSSWSFPTLIGEDALVPSAGIIAGNGRGDLVVVYNGNKDGNGMYMVESHDTGGSWSESTPIYLTDSPKLIPYYLKSYVGESGRVHVVWNVNVSEDGTYDSLFYTRIDLATGEWIKPLLLDKRPDETGYFGPSVPAVVDNGKYVIIMYNGGNPFTDGIVPVGRPTILTLLSKDGGNTWGDLTSPFPFLTGQSGEHVLLIDSNQVIRMIANMRIDRLIDGKYKAVGGVWYSEYKDGAWRSPQRFVTTIPAVDIRAVVSQGNVILATWNEDPLAGWDGVWFSYTMLDSPELPINPLPVPTIEDNGSISNVVSNDLNVESVPTVTSMPNDLWSNDEETVMSPQMPILVGIIPVFILLVVVIIRTIQAKRR